MRTTEKSWFVQKGYGFLQNGSEDAPDITVQAKDLLNCEYLRPGRAWNSNVISGGHGLVGKNVILIPDELDLLVAESHKSFKNLRSS